MLKKNLIIVFLILAFKISSAQDTVFLSLNQALEMAVEQNQLIKIFQYKIDNADGKLREMKSNYYPRVIAEGNFGYNSNPNVTAKKGQFSFIYEELLDDKDFAKYLEDNFPLPPKKITMVKGEELFCIANVSLYQPLSQLTTVNTGRKITDIDLNISKLQLDNVISEISLGIKELFYGILIEEKYEEVALYQLEYNIANYNDVKNAFESGEALKIDVTALEAEIYEKEQELLEAQNKKESYVLSFKQLVGIDFNVKAVLILDSIDLFDFKKNIADYYILASQNNYELNISNATVGKAKLGITAAKKAYIPELSYFAKYNYQHGIPLTPDNYFMTGLNLKWTLIASGERSALIKQRNALYNEALKDFEYKSKTVKVEVHKAFLDLTYAYKLIQTAKKALEVRTEELILVENSVEEGEALPSRLLMAKADYAKAEADLLGSKLNYLISLSKLNRLTGLQ